MARLHELLAAEKTPTGAWNQLFEDTKKKFGNVAGFFTGFSKSLKMIEENPANANIEAQAREEKPVVTNVIDTLEYALGIFATAEDLQYQKNATNQLAKADVMWRGKSFIEGLPVDELLGLEARLAKLRALFADIPTLDASKHWEKALAISPWVWETQFPEETTKTEKTILPLVLAPATDKHPAQVDKVTKDVVVGKFTTIHRSGAVTAAQKSEAIKRIDELLVEVKQARMRANLTEVVSGKIAKKIVDLLMEPLRDAANTRNVQNG